MESKLQTFSAFQVYSTGTHSEINVMVDQLWIENNRIFFRVVEGIPPNKNIFRKERRPNVFSVSREELLSIRCRLYF